MAAINLHTYKGHPEWRDPGFCYYEWRDSGFGQNLGRESGFATSGGSGIKSFFMAGNGISRHRRDRNLDSFAICWRDSKYYPFHPSIWLFRLSDPKPRFIHTNQRNRIQTQTLTQDLSFHLSILWNNSTFQSALHHREYFAPTSDFPTVSPLL